MEPGELAVPSQADGEPPVRVRDGVWFCAGVYLIVRILLSLVAVIGVRNGSFASGQAAGAQGQGAEEPASAGLHNAIDGTVRWDAYWYLAIARDGYEASGADAAFFPGYPVLIHIVDTATPIGTVGAALLVSNAAFLGSLIVLYALTRLEYSEAVARKTVVLLAVFPSSFFFLAPYSESVFLLASLCTFWLFRRGRWYLAGVAAAIAIATRATGVLLLPAMLVDAFGGRRDGVAVWRRSVATIAPGLVLIAYGLWWYGRNGDALAPVHAQSEWMRSLTFPLVTSVDAVRLAIEGVGDPRGIYWTGDLVLTLWLVVPLVIAWRRLAPPFVVYAGLSVVVPLMYPLPARPLLSVPRFLIVVFPAFWAIALLLRDRRTTWIVVGISVIGFVIASVAFMNWGFMF